MAPSETGPTTGADPVTPASAAEDVDVDADSPAADPATEAPLSTDEAAQRDEPVRPDNS